MFGEEVTQLYVGRADHRVGECLILKQQKSIATLDPIALEEEASKARSFVVQFEVTDSPCKVWTVISDNDLIRRKLQMGQVDFHYIPIEEGGTLIEGEYKVPLGKAHFIEKPFEWVVGRYSYGARLFDRGPFRFASLELSMQSIADNRTMIRAELKLAMQGLLRHLVLKKMQRAVEQFPAKIRELIHGLHSDQSPGFEASLNPERHLQTYHKYRSGLKKLSAFPAPLEAVADFASRSSQRFLQKLKPYEIADYYNIARYETLEFFLEGTQKGLFNLSWDLLCPSCRGAKKQSKSLREVDPDVHCDACGITFRVLDSKDVELTFSFAGDLQVGAEPIYCVGNPGRSPQVHIQLPLAPGTERREALHLPGQTYRLRSLQTGQLLRIKINAAGLDELDLTTMSGSQKNHETLRLKPDFILHWRNTAAYWQVLRFDCLDPNAQAATADQVASLPSYQHLFGDDALRPGMDLGVGHLVFLFSDIRGSTALYQELGDSKAFRLVQDHFTVMEQQIKKERGTIVKTIGDAVMASFLDEAAALSAAMAIQHYYEAPDVPHQLPGLKIALHAGPCIMVNLNDRMDYFGTTVNTCSRLLDLAEEEDIMISDALWQKGKVQAVLAKEAVKVSREERHVRGLSQAQIFYRLRWERKKTWTKSS